MNCRGKYSPIASLNKELKIVKVQDPMLKRPQYLIIKSPGVRKSLTN